MATIAVVNVAGDALQQVDIMKFTHESKSIQISIAPIEDDDDTRTGHSTDSVYVERSRQNTEERIAQLQQDISVLKVDLERCIHEAVAGSQTSSSAEKKKRLQGKTNAAYKAWAARELILSDLLSSLQTPDDCSTKSSSTVNSGTLSIQPYPTSTMPTSPKLPADISPSATAFMKQIGWVKPASLIQYLNSGVDINGMGQYPAYPQHPITPLMAIIRSPFVSESTEVIQLLLDQGADPCLRDARGLSAYAHVIYTRRKEAVRAIVHTLSDSEQRGIPTGYASMNLDTTWTGAKRLRWEAAVAIINNDYDTLSSLLSDNSLRYSIIHTACLPLAILFSNIPAVKLLLAYGIQAFELFQRTPSDSSRPFTSPVSMAIYTQSLEMVSTIIFHSIEASERRGRLWYAQIFGSIPGTYRNKEIIDFVLDNIPLVEALDRAIMIEDRDWIHRIVTRTVALLLQPDVDGNKGRNSAAEAFWILVERAFSTRACSRQVLAASVVELVEQETGRDFMYVACGGSLGISLSFAEMILGVSSRKCAE